MKKLYLAYILSICLFFANGQNNNNLTINNINIDTLDVLLTQVMKDFELPGLSIGIVHNDSIIYSRGFGTREYGKNLPADENTLFGIGSISKSFVSLTLGILVDEGKLNWDDKVIKYLPEFKLYDPYVTENFTIRDLLTHRSGLKQVSGGTFLISSEFTRNEIIEKIQYLKPVSGFRDKPAYQNIMYVVAAEIVGVVSGSTWEDFLQKRVLNELDMVNTVYKTTIRESSRNLAKPHIFDENFKRVQITQEKSDNAAPAGFIFSSATDMGKYMKLLLNDGVINKDTIISKKELDEIFKPQIHYQFLPKPMNNEFTSYGFGWFITPKDGNKIIEHSGGIDGASANLMMVKNLNFGIIVMCNASELAAFALTHKVLEKFMADKDYDTYELLKKTRDYRFQKEKEDKINFEKYQIKNTKPSLNLKSYAGTYNDRMYGDIFIKLTNKNELEIVFPKSHHLKGKLKHWHYDTFLIDWVDIRVPDGLLTFNFDSVRDIVGFKIDQENLLDVDFEELEILKKELE